MAAKREDDSVVFRVRAGYHLRMPTFSSDQTRRVARLACIALTPNELAALTQELEVVLTHVGRVDTVVAQSKQVRSDLSGSYRADRAEPSLSQAVAVAPAADSERGYFLVPRVIA